MLNFRRIGSDLLALLIVVSAAMSAHADVAFTNLGTGSLASWSTLPGTPVYTSLATPATANTAQGNVAAATGATNTAMVETFTPSSSFTLGAISIAASGGQAATNVTLHLYDVTSAITSNNGTTTQGSGAIYTPITSSLTDLLGGGSGLSFSNPAQNEAQLLFQLSIGATNDQVALTAGHIYAMEFWTPSASNGSFLWWRAPSSVATDGQMMTATDATKSGTGASTVNANFTTEDARITIASAGQAGGAAHRLARSVCCSRARHARSDGHRDTCRTCVGAPVSSGSWLRPTKRTENDSRSLESIERRSWIDRARSGSF